ncbi:hypothetical protein O181_118439 [Austropuccinia psidii MF-1]|uniref:Uncharacterized protein n=1 Tax=Austropuccinia psidii MF-1 TaxID=1389203 RepID=A0A9Q3KFA9_9BASI|nr:hypothetical protein [Austropuccinia psidii MF-1]
MAASSLCRQTIWSLGFIASNNLSSPKEPLNTSFSLADTSNLIVFFREVGGYFSRLAAVEVIRLREEARSILSSLVQLVQSCENYVFGPSFHLSTFPICLNAIFCLEYPIHCSLHRPRVNGLSSFYFIIALPKEPLHFPIESIPFLFLSNMSSTGRFYGSGYSDFISSFSPDELEELLFGYPSSPSRSTTFWDWVNNPHSTPPSSPALAPLSNASSPFSYSEGVPEAAMAFYAFIEGDPKDAISREGCTPTIYAPVIPMDGLLRLANYLR